MKAQPRMTGNTYMVIVMKYEPRQGTYELYEPFWKILDLLNSKAK